MSTPASPIVDLNHPTPYPLRIHILRSRASAIIQAMHTHEAIRHSLQDLQITTRHAVSPVFLQAVWVEYERVSNVLKDLEAEGERVREEMEIVEKEEAKRLKEEEKKGCGVM